LAEAPFRATLEIDAPDVASLATLVTASPGLSGPLKGKLLLEGSLSRLAATGDLQLERLVVSEHRSQCPPPPRRTLEFRDVALPVRYSPAALEGAPVRARLAGGTVSARVEMRLDPSPVVSLRDLGLRGVQLEPVLGRYLCAGYAVSGPLDLTGEARMRIDDPLPTMTGAGRFQIGPGKVVGGEALAAISDVVRLADTTALPSELARLVTARTPPSFESITATYRIVDGVARTDDLLYRSHGFTVSAAGSYGLADRRLEMNVTFTQGGNHVRALVTASPTGRLRIVPTGLQPADSGGVRRFIDRLMR
jgi:hypothetical protein